MPGLKLLRPASLAPQVRKPSAPVTPVHRRGPAVPAAGKVGSVAGPLTVNDQLAPFASAMPTATPVAVLVAAALITTWVASVTELIVVPTGIPSPVNTSPTSAALKAADAELRVVVDVVTPSVTVRDVRAPFSASLSMYLCTLSAPHVGRTPSA